MKYGLLTHILQAIRAILHRLTELEGVPKLWCENIYDVLSTSYAQNWQVPLLSSYCLTFFYFHEALVAHQIWPFSSTKEGTSQASKK